MSHLLVSEKMPWSIMGFGYASIIPLIATGLFGWKTIDAVSGLLQGEERIQTICLDVAPPPICNSFEAYPEPLSSIIWLMVSVGFVVVCWMLAVRRRAIWLDDDGTVRVVWGDGLYPITFRRYPFGSLSNCSVVRERRVTLSPIVGTSVTRVGRAPDRWRLRALFGGSPVDLGSYSTEEEGNRAADMILKGQYS